MVHKCHSPIISSVQICGMASHLNPPKCSKKERRCNLFFISFPVGAINILMHSISTLLSYY